MWAPTIENDRMATVSDQVDGLPVATDPGPCRAGGLSRAVVEP
jgi:hypothetical protein